MKYLSLEHCQERYPRLCKAMRWAAILTPSEAGACIRDYRQGLEYSGEAVNHFGGTKAVIKAAIKARKRERLSRGAK